MTRAVVLSLVLFLAARPAVGESPGPKQLEYLLRTAGYATDDANLRALLRSAAAPEKHRLLVLDLLGWRRVPEITEDIQAALQQELPQSLLVRMTSTLFASDPRRFEATAIEVAARIPSIDKRVSVAADLARHGSPALYPVLLESLEAHDPWTRHLAIGALGALAVESWSRVEPDPFEVLIKRALFPKPPERYFERSESSTREEIAWQLARVLCRGATPERWAVGLRSARKLSRYDDWVEVREAARKAADAMAMGHLIGAWPPDCLFPAKPRGYILEGAGLSLESEDLKTYLVSDVRSEEFRVVAAELLAARSDTTASVALRRALGTQLSLSGIARIAHGLLGLEGAKAAPAIVEAASRSQARDLKLYLAQDLAHRGEVGLYSVLVEGLRGEGEIARHIALGGIAALSRLPTAATLEPDPVNLLIETLAAATAGLREEAAEALGDASYFGDDVWRLAALKALQAVAVGDSATEVRAAASEAVKSLEKQPAESAPGSPLRANAQNGATP